MESESLGILLYTKFNFKLNKIVNLKNENNNLEIYYLEIKL